MVNGESVIVLLTTFSTLLGLVLVITKRLREIRDSLRDNHTLIGVPAGVPVPDELSGLPDYTNYDKALHSEAKIVLYHTKNVTKALRLCDFVLVTQICDPKFVFVDNPDGMKKAVGLINGQAK